MMLFAEPRYRYKLALYIRIHAASRSDGVCISKPTSSGVPNTGSNGKPPNLYPHNGFHRPFYDTLRALRLS